MTPLGDAPVQKLDRCYMDAIVKFLGGTAVGFAASGLLFRWKRWPVLLCSGIGIGMAINNCEVSLNELQNISKHRSDKDTGELKVAK